MFDNQDDEDAFEGLFYILAQAHRQSQIEEEKEDLSEGYESKGEKRKKGNKRSCD